MSGLLGLFCANLYARFIASKFFGGLGVSDDSLIIIPERQNVLLQKKINILTMMTVISRNLQTPIKYFFFTKIIVSGLSFYLMIYLFCVLQNVINCCRTCMAFFTIFFLYTMLIVFCKYGIFKKKKSSQKVLRMTCNTPCVLIYQYYIGSRHIYLRHKGSNLKAATGQRTRYVNAEAQC